MGRINSGFGEALDARNPKRIAEAIADVPESIKQTARKMGIKWRLGAHSVDLVEDADLVIACLLQRFAQLADLPNELDAKLSEHVRTQFETSTEDTANILDLAQWLTSQLGEPESKTYWLSKRLEELEGYDGFLRFAPALDNLLEGQWSKTQIAVFEDVKRVFDIS